MYANLPKSDWPKMDDCVTKVMATGKDKQAAIAICYTSISKQQGDDEMSRQDRAKAKKRRAAKQTAVITDLSELGQAFGWSEKDVKASYPWDSCIADQMKRYGSRTRAEKICGAIRANAGKALSDERIATIIRLSPVTAPNFRAKATDKGITDAPNLRVEDAQCCGNCQYYKELASGDNGMGMMASDAPDDSGICTKYDFEADEDWVCDSWEAVATPDVAGAIQDAAQAIADAADTMQMPMKEQHAIAVFKQADGRLRVVGWASNNRRDKDNPPEIITEAAHKEFMSYLDAHPEHAPEFWHWHTPGTKYAKADWWDYADGFTVYSGLVDAGKEAQAEKAAAEGIGMSHGFHVLGYDNANHHITQYRTFEVSDLPKSRAANPYTSFSTIRKEASMAFSEAKKAYLLERLPAETVAELERKTSDLKAAADAAGIEAKDIEETPVVAEVTAEEKAQDKPTDKPATVTADGGDAKPKADSNADEMDKRMRAMIREELASMGKEVKAAVLTVAEAVKATNERVATVEATAAKAEEVAKSAVVANAKSLDEIVAEMISPAPLRKGYRASAAADTKIETKKEGVATPAVKAVEEPTLTGTPEANWWQKEVMDPIGIKQPSIGGI